MGLALIWLSNMLIAYTIGRTRPLRALGFLLKEWGRRNSSRTLPWYRKHTADAIGLAWIGLMFATHPRRTWQRLREYRNPPPRPAAPKLNPNWPNNPKEN